MSSSVTSSKNSSFPAERLSLLKHSMHQSTIISVYAEVRSMKRDSTSSFPQFISFNTICFPMLFMISRQLNVISLSIQSTKREVMMSINLKHLIRWCSFALMNDKFLTIRTIILRWSISSSSVTSQCKTITSFFLFLLSSSRAYYSSYILILGFLPLALG